MHSSTGSRWWSGAGPRRCSWSGETGPTDERPANGLPNVAPDRSLRTGDQTGRKTRDQAESSAFAESHHGRRRNIVNEPAADHLGSQT